MIKKILLGILILILGIVAFYWYKFSHAGRGGDSGPKQAPLALKKHSEKFNSSVANAMNAYFEIKSAFVDADSAKVKENGRQFIKLLDSIPLAELKNDTASIYETAQSNLNDIKANAASLLVQTDITEMRRDFSTVSEMLYPSFFKTINYEGPNIYWQNCPMAFGEDKGANWLSSTKEIINPYLGKNHPEFRGTMLHCGEVKDTVKAQ